MLGLALVFPAAIAVLPLPLTPDLAAGIAIQGGDFDAEFQAALAQTDLTPAGLLYPKSQPGRAVSWSPGR